jgi:hypothetical protein
MPFLKIMNKQKPFINDIFRYSHHRCLTDIPKNIHSVPSNYTIINLLGSQKSVDKASWEIKSYAVEKSLFTANIVCDTGILQNLLAKNNNLQFIVNRCYDMSYQNLLYLNHDIIQTNPDWQLYNLYVMPHATNRFTTCNFIRNCSDSNIIVYPLAAPEEKKRRDIHILIE